MSFTSLDLQANDAKAFSVVYYLKEYTLFAQVFVEALILASEIL